MREDLLRVLACPKDGSDLEIRAPRRVDGEIESGTLVCERSHEFPILRYIPRFVPSDYYVRSFSMEWLIHKSTQYDSSTGEPNTLNSFNLKTGFSRKQLEGRLVLDAGCGSGRFMEVARDLGATVVGLDLSNAVDAARQMVGYKEGTHLVQGDILNPPFKPSSFDLVYSIGVLHHTENTKKGFMSLCPLLKRGGTIAIWVYPDGGATFKVMNLVGQIHRKGASIMTLDALYRVCKGMAALPVPKAMLDGPDRDPTKTAAKGYRSPRQFVFLVFPFYSLAPSYDWRVLDTFDYLAPRYQSKHTWGEIGSWFRQAGLTEVKPLQIAVSFSGRRP